MEAVNEGCKLVAQARESVLKYLSADDHHYEYLLEARILLDKALEKLSSST